MKIGNYKVKLNITTYTEKGEKSIFNYRQNTKEIYLKKYSHEFNDGCYIVRDNSQNMIQEKESLIDLYPENKNILFRIRKSIKYDKYEIINPIRTNMQKNENNIKSLNEYNAWYVTNSSKEEKNDFKFENNNEEYILNNHDIIKLGFNTFEIIEKHIIDEGKKNLRNINYNISKINSDIGPIFDINLKSNQYEEKKIIYNNNNKEDGIEYIDNIKNMENSKALKEQEKENNSNTSNKDDNNNNHKKCSKGIECKGFLEENNPLLNLCKCNKYIHYKCLKENLECKKNVKDNITNYKCTNFFCDKCLTPYLIQFKISDKLYSLIDFEKPNSNYIILESLNDNYEQKQKIKNIYLIKFNDKNNKIISMGSNAKNDIIINWEKDSISREHAEIIYDEKIKNIILRNKKGKYGTLVLIKGNIELSEKKINFQVGNSYITANLVKNDKK